MWTWPWTYVCLSLRLAVCLSSYLPELKISASMLISSVCLSVCLLLAGITDFGKYVNQSRMFVCLFVCLFVCKLSTGRTFYGIVPKFIGLVHNRFFSEPIVFGDNPFKVKVKVTKKHKNRFFPITLLEINIDTQTVAHFLLHSMAFQAIDNYPESDWHNFHNFEEKMMKIEFIF